MRQTAPEAAVDAHQAAVIAAATTTAAATTAAAAGSYCARGPWPLLRCCPCFPRFAGSRGRKTARRAACGAVNAGEGYLHRLAPVVRRLKPAAVVIFPIPGMSQAWPSDSRSLHGCT